ncbi:MAG: type II toxin-antitoxin system Phd/YefM family antitoxin, partial [Nitrospirota bacterium]|nr:type II toxin-antitoxin system Phd/YefM family antitoxin [Nitrospirota bacterium]
NLITSRGRASAVMISIKEYEHTQHELELLGLLADGEKEVEAGTGHRLDDILAEADALLKEPRR